MSSQLIEILNQLLLSKLTASNRCLANAELCDEHGYQHLLDANERRGKEEMAHARALIARLVALRARPVPTQQEPVPVEDDISRQIVTGLQAAEEALGWYQQGIRLATDAGDPGTRELLEQMLADEQRQLTWLRSQVTRLEELGLQGYLRQQA